MKLSLPLSLLGLCALSLLAQPALLTRAAPADTASTSPAVDPYWPKDGVFTAKGKTSSWKGFPEKNRQRRALFASEKASDQNGLVFVGDSITEGWKTLADDFADVGLKVVNRGISGDTTPNLLYRFQEDVLSLHPRALVILIGTNDLGEHTMPEDIASNLRDLQKLIRKKYPKIPVAWCLVMPRGDPQFMEPIQALNTLIRDLAKGDSHTTICDTYSVLAKPDHLANPDDFVPDLLHLNPTGYVTWRAAVHPIIDSWKLGAKK